MLAHLKNTLYELYLSVLYIYKRSGVRLHNFAAASLSVGRKVCQWEPLKDIQHTGVFILVNDYFRIPSGKQEVEENFTRMENKEMRQ